jgi:hypothetical protein
MIIGSAVALAALCASAASTAAYGAESAPRASVTSYSVVGYMAAVAAVSPSDAWAAGFTGTTAPKTLLVHWNGHKWSPVTNPKPVPGQLAALDAVSADNIWAAGSAGPTSAPVALIMHWNGSAWSRVSGVPSVAGTLVSIEQTGNILLASGGLEKPPMLFMQRTGTKWKIYPSPVPAGSLESIALTGHDSGWVAGIVGNSAGSPVGDILMRWSGTGWKSVSFPLKGTNDNLWSVSAGPGGAVWAVGDGHNSALTTYTPLSMVWNGKTWRKVAVSAPANSALFGVSFIPGGTAWAVGQSADGAHTLALHWTGTAWKQAATPNPQPTSDFLDAVSATSPDNAWAVGVGGPATSPKTFILHWNGKAWS